MGAASSEATPVKMNAGAGAELGAGTWAEVASLGWLATKGVATVERVVAATPEAALLAFESFGSPVVLKLADNRILHKSDAGCVRTGLCSDVDVLDAYAIVQKRGAALLGDHGSDFDVLVEPQLSGIEVLLGIRRDPSLGPFVVFGAGGALAEWFDDGNVACAPVTLAEAAALVQASRVRTILEGFRGSEPVDEDALAALYALVVSLSNIAVEHRRIVELDLNPVLVGAAGAVPVDARIVMTEEQPDPIARTKRPLASALFEPRAVAVVGASRDPLKPGGRVLRYLTTKGFDGDIYPVNPRAATVQGVTAYPSVAAAPAHVDLACIAVPSELVGRAIDDCIDAGVSNAVVFSAGFGETGDAGHSRRQALKESLASSGVELRVVGPNSNGIVSLDPPVYAAIGMAFEIQPEAAGPVALVTQSGAVGSALLSRGWDEHVGFSRWISTGNELDVSLDEYLRYLAHDDRTKVVLLFLEGVRDGVAFLAAAEECRRAGKALVAFKTARSPVGRRTAVSHTGMIAGDDRLFNALLRRAGVVRVGTLHGLIDAGRVLTNTHLPCGRNVAVISMSGGVASVLADECSTCTLLLPTLPPETVARLQESLPRYCTVSNPLDVTADAVARPQILADAVEAMLSCPAVDLVMVQLTTNAEPSASSIAKMLVGMHPTKPLLISRLGSPRLAPDAISIYSEAGIPVFSTPESMVQAARVLVETSEARRG